ncbi:MAG: hypothetical protein F7B17_05660 [Desulfurococcales archaeon]|nr:hypothetical protein [Desulfurococcales archaeon]
MAFKTSLASVMGVLLVIAGLAMLLVVFAQAFKEAQQFTLNLQVEGGLVDILTENSRLLIEMLVKVAFLAVALAAGSIVLGRGVDALKGCPEKR